ncbi:MAG TPA: amidophosphoribosyltransferase [Spirochaetota bacterium]|nr:amidophosphoribosyltransferase [Spirochaetota bacterium]
MGGFFGVTSHGDCVADLFYGTDYHSHLGTRRGGMAVCNDKDFMRYIHDISNAQFRSKFELDVLKLTGRSGIGVISDYEDQPLLISSHLGNYAIVTVGAIKNIKELVKKAFANRVTHFSEMVGGEINPTELVATIINQGSTIKEGLKLVQESIEGSCSILLLTTEGIYASRDKYGRTPIVIGKKNGSYAVAMDTCAFPNLEYEIEHYLGPGEITLVKPEGYQTVAPAGDKLKICTFLWIYYGYPASSYEGINSEVVRNRNGRLLAKNDDVVIDSVSGIPDSGVGHALGYAHEAKVPYTRSFVKYTPTWSRSFMPQHQKKRDLIASMKLIPVRELIDGKKLLYCDDSVVRGTQLRDIISRLYNCGAKEIHMRLACPPLVYTCKYLNFSRSRNEMDLAARREISKLEGGVCKNLEAYTDSSSECYKKMVNNIREGLGLTTLKYQDLKSMLDAVGLPHENLCTYCWDGKE